MSGSDKRRWFRMAPKGLVARAGRLLLGPNTQPIECKIVGLSASGAQLELQRVYDLPERFDFLHGSIKRHCARWHGRAASASGFPTKQHRPEVSCERRTEPAQEWRRAFVASLDQ